MKLKNYMIIEAGIDKSGVHNKLDASQPLKVKIRRGLLTKDLREALDVKDSWTPDPTKVERPYFLPGCSVPRFKVRETFNITIKPEYATAAFISPETLEGSADTFESMTRMYPYPADEILHWIRTVYGDKHYFTVKVASLAPSCESTILMHNDCVEKLRMAGLQVPDSKNPPKMKKMANGSKVADLDGYRLMDHVESVYPPRTNLFIPQPDSIFDRLRCDLYDQKVMLKIVNQNCMIIDKGKYEELCVMASASDKENLSTVMELIANCDFDKSCIYLLCLLRKYGLEMAKLKGAGHVNFKSLLHYFNLSVKDIQGVSGNKDKNRLTLDKLVETLQKLGKLTSTNFQQLAALFPTDDKSTDESNIFVQPGYALKEEYLSQLDDEDIIEDADDTVSPEMGAEFINQQ